MNRKLAKKIITKLSFIRPVKTFFVDRKYYSIDFGTLLVNFLMQRLLRINSKSKWMVHFTSRIIFSHKIHISEGINSYTVYRSLATSGCCYLQAGNDIFIGEGVIWAYGIKIISANHSISDYSSWEPGNPIKIGNFVWLGTNSVILPNVELGDHIIVGAGAVVNKSFPGYTILGGLPAKIIGYRCKKCFRKLIEHGEILNCTNCNIEYDKNEFELNES